MFRFATALVCGWVCCSCLPADTRPVPSSVYVTAEPSEALKEGFTTSDGWTIELERFVTALGDVDLDPEPDGAEDSCISYSDTHYEWLFDFTQARREKVAIVYGLGTCSVEFRLRGPSDECVLGAGATQEDVTSMRMQGTDAWEEDARVALVASGFARKDGVEKRFEWRFRRSFDIELCVGAEGEGYESVLLLEGEEGQEELTLPLEVRAEELFRRAPTDEAPLHFDLYASADSDNDGEVTLEELDAVQAPPQDEWIGADEEEDEEPVETLGDLVYIELLPRVARVRGSSGCQFEKR